MIELTKINEKKVMINSEWIETIECVPDTIITMTQGNKHIVKESSEEIRKKIVEYKQMILIGVNELRGD